LSKRRLDLFIGRPGGSARGVTPPSQGGGGTSPVAPVLNTPTINNTSPAVGNALVAFSTYSNTPTPTPTLSYQWKANGINVGTDSSSYTVLSGDLAKTITVTVTATNAAGSSSATSAATGAVSVVLVAPSFTVGAAISGAAAVGSALTAVATATGNPTPTLTYQWYWADTNAAISGATSSTYVPVSGDAGHTIKVTVTATNSKGSASSTSTPTSAVPSGSATAPAWDPAKRGSQPPTLSNSNLTAANTTGGANSDNATVLGTAAITSGKVMFTVHVDSLSGYGVSIGVSKSPLGTYLGYFGSVAWESAGYLPRNNDYQAAPGHPYGAGATVGVLVDWTAKKVWFTPDGVSFYGMADPAVAASGIYATYTASQVAAGQGGIALNGAVGDGSPLYPAVHIYNTGAVTANFSATQPFAAPTGFTTIDGSALTAVANASRVGQISTDIAGRSVPIPQSFWDNQANEAEDPNTHPSLGTFTHTATKSGLWSDTTVWNTGTVPGTGAIVNTSTFTITYDVESNLELNGIHVSGSGTLKWKTTADTKLIVDTIMVHGTLVMGTSDDPITNSATPGKPRADIIFKQVVAPGATTRLGLSTMGPVRIHGQAKESRLFAPANIAAGATTITLDGDVASWSVGDTVLVLGMDDPGISSTDASYVGPTKFFGPFQGSTSEQSNGVGFKQSHDEVRTITAISGQTITLSSALTYAHAGASGTLTDGTATAIKPVVANLTRSIRFSSASTATLQNRGHIMFMHSDDVDVRYFECKDLARTDTNPSLTSPNSSQLVGPAGGVSYTNASGSVVTVAQGAPISDPNNVRGRYAFHFHGNGAFLSRRMCIAKGAVAWAPTNSPPQPGWAITHHNAHAAIEDCVVYNVRGAGIVSENGNEIGQWLNNTVAWARGDGFQPNWGVRSEIIENHNGHQGTAYENQARQVLQQGNIASSSHYGWYFLQQATGVPADTTPDLKRVPDVNSLRVRDPLAFGGGWNSVLAENVNDHTYGREQAQIVDFHDNSAFGCTTGWVVGHRQFIERGESFPLEMHRYRTKGTLNPITILNYTYFYNFRDFFWVDGDMGANMGGNSFQFNFTNGLIRNFAKGIVDGGLGHNWNGFWIDLKFESVAQPFVNTPYTYFFDDPARSYAYGAMGPLTITDPNNPNPGFTGYPREWKSISSATDLPQPYPIAPYGMGGVQPPNDGTRQYSTANAYFWLDTSFSDTTIDPTSYNAISIRGRLVDSVGVRVWPSHHTYSTAVDAAYEEAPPRSNIFGTGLEIVARNGCFTPDGGTTWKSRLWFTDADRFTGDYIRFYVDITLTGFDPSVLAANTIDQMAFRPTLPLLPMAIAPSAITVDTVPPTIASTATLSVKSGFQLGALLKSNEGHPKWRIAGGADAAKFQISAAAPWKLQWAADGIKSFSAPDDAGANNVYNVDVGCADPFGNESIVQHTVTVTDHPSALPFSDDFNTGQTILENRYGWYAIDGATAPGVATVSNGMLQFAAGTAASIWGFGPGTLPSSDHYIETVFTSGGTTYRLLCRMTDAKNWIGMYRSWDGNVYVTKRVNSLETQLASFSNPSTSPVRLTVTGSAFTVSFNGVNQTPTSGSLSIGAGPAPANRVGVYVDQNGMANTITSITCGSVAAVAFIPRTFPTTGIVAIGDSITQGVGASSGAMSYPSQLATLTGLTVQNLGASGDQLAIMNSEWGSASPTFGPNPVPFYNTSTTNTLVIEGGGADARDIPATVAGMQASIQSLVAKARTTGFKVAVSTTLPLELDSGAMTQAKRDVIDGYNAWLKANWSNFADVLVDFTAVPGLTNADNATYFADKIHPNDTGYALMAEAVRSALGLTALATTPASFVISNASILDNLASDSTVGTVSGSGTTSDTHKPTYTISNSSILDNQPINTTVGTVS
jgi:lysophospholipase L1-like esterase